MGQSLGYTSKCGIGKSGYEKNEEQRTKNNEPYYLKFHTFNYQRHIFNLAIITLIDAFKNTNLSAFAQSLVKDKIATVMDSTRNQAR